MSKNHVIVTAARHAFGGSPLCVDVTGLGIEESGALSVKDVASGSRSPAQLMVESSRKLLCWIPKDLAIGQTQEYEIVSDAAPASGIELVDVDGEKIDIMIGGALFTSYYYTEKYVRPFLYPVIGPGGRGMTRNYPMMTGVPGETEDHHHHKSLYVAHGEVNGADVWSEEEGHGRIVHRKFLEKTSGPVFGRIKTLNDWQDNQGKKLLEEVRTVTIYNLPDTGRMIDLDIVFRMTEGDVKFGDTKEGGIVSIRVATSMDGDKSGIITNAFGGVTEAENWGKPAHWCDYSGLVDKKMVGIAVFDNPKNFRYPTRWHVRDYGLFTANPFAMSAYLNDPNVDGSHVVKAGELFPFSYRIYIHDGSAETANVGEKYHGYINPPAVK